MPDVPFFLTLTPPRQLSTLGNSEIVSVTNVSTDTLTIVRAQKGTTAKTIAAGWVASNGVYVEDINAFNGYVSDETPTGSVDGSNTTFTTSKPYIGASLEVFVNGLKQKRSTHFVETTPSSGTFTISDAPLSGDVVSVNYQFEATSSTNSDTVDGFHASATPTANSLIALGSSGKLPVSLYESPWMRATHLGRPSHTESTTYTFVRIDLNNTSSGGGVGSYLTFDSTNKRIVVGSGVSKVRVSAQLQAWNGPAALELAAEVRHNGTTIGMIIANHNTNELVPYTMPPKTISVSEGDYIEIGFNSSSTGTYTWIFDNAEKAWLQVEVVG